MAKPAIVGREPAVAQALAEKDFARHRIFELERSRGGQDRRPDVARRHIGLAEIVENLEQIGLQRGRPLEVSDGFGGAAERDERGAEIAVGLGMVRIDGQDLIILRDRGVRPALLGQHIGKIEMRDGEIRARPRWRAHSTPPHPPIGPARGAHCRD